MTRQLELFQGATSTSPAAAPATAPQNGDRRLWYIQNTDGEAMRKFTLRMLARFYKKHRTQPVIVLAHRDDLVGEIGLFCTEAIDNDLCPLEIEDRFDCELEDQSCYCFKSAANGIARGAYDYLAQLDAQAEKK